MSIHHPLHPHPNPLGPLLARDIVASSRRSVGRSPPRYDQSHWKYPLPLCLCRFRYGNFIEAERSNPGSGSVCVVCCRSGLSPRRATWARDKIPKPTKQGNQITEMSTEKLNIGSPQVDSREKANIVRQKHRDVGEGVVCSLRWLSVVYRGWGSGRSDNQWDVCPKEGRLCISMLSMVELGRGCEAGRGGWKLGTHLQSLHLATTMLLPMPGLSDPGDL